MVFDSFVQRQSEPIITGLAFPECPRWHDGHLWFSDQHGGWVYRVEHDGTATAVVEVPGGPSGLGWRPDGSMLVVSMGECRVLRWADEQLQPYADLSAYHQWHSNDMLVDVTGRAYVGSIGFDYYAGASPVPTVLVRIDPDGTTAVAADDLNCPNGMVTTSDGTTLIVAESLAHRLTAFTIGPHGELSRRRTMADLGELIPDGICRDEQHRVWFASIGQHEVVRVTADGALDVTVSTGAREVIACELGGSDGRTLYMCTSVSMHPDDTVRNRDGAIEIVELPAQW
jgi:sugar lactone lactonase YvrE